MLATKNKKTESEYLSLYSALSEMGGITYAEFDAGLLNGLSLFATPDDEHFRTLEASLDKIIRAIPALKRIFAKPIIRLKDTNEILPVESVRVINSRSIAHLSAHSELWGDANPKNFKPKKIMTLDKEEDYAIYENVAFSRLIDMILSFTKNNARLLKDVMYASRDLKFNLLERTNHLSYFLAIGKLHVGYAREHSKHAASYERCLQKLIFIDRSIKEKLQSPVYRHCKKNKAKLTLKKTNVFRLHKDYKQVYNLIEWFLDGRGQLDETPTNTISAVAYAAFCNALTLFAAGHFNFDFGAEKLNPLSLNTTGNFKGWTLQLKSTDEYLLFTFKKDSEYTVALNYAPNGRINISDGKNNQLMATPFENSDKNALYLTLFDIDSFLRLQQLILRGMIYTDKTRDVCPFCGNPLTYAEGHVECLICRTQIFDRVCPETGKNYIETGIKEFVLKKGGVDETSKRDKFYTDKIAEARLHYRNITPLSQSGKAVCPHCNKTH